MTSSLRTALTCGLLAAFAPAVADAATFVVTTAADDGNGSLRAAIKAANLTAEADVINFAIGTGEVEIVLQTPLPSITQRLKIEGFSQSPVGGNVPRVRLVGSQLASGQGLKLAAPDCIGGLCSVRGLQIVEFPLEGIVIDAGLWTIRGKYIGTDGSTARGNARNGISVNADQATIGGPGANEANVISANGYSGIGLYSTGALIEGNRIGTDAAGTIALPNASHGIRIFGDNNQIGGFQVGAGNPISGNLISGNGLDGVVIESEAEDNVVVANRIGTNAAGNAALANGGSGIAIYGPRTLVGLTGFGNVVSGNTYSGIGIGGDAAGSALYDNRIGTDASGTLAVPNQSDGIRVLEASAIDIGGGDVGEGNLISGNLNSQLAIDGEASAIRVLGNRIGTTADGNAALGAGAGGMGLYGRDLQIGQAGAGNLISGNEHGGIAINGANAENIRIQGNRIGTSADGLASLPNGSSGIRSIQGRDITIGGSNIGEGNVISGNLNSQLEIDGEAIRVLGNWIGTTADGNAALGAGAVGIGLYGRDLQIGQVGAGNLISGNEQNGIMINGADAENIRIQGNRIGTRGDGMASLANGSYGIRGIQGRNVTIGGSGANEGNLVSGNGRGVSIEDGMIDTLVQGNVIGLDAMQTAKLGNGTWSGLDVSGPGTIVGGSVAGAGNVIAGHADSGVTLYGSSVPGPIVQGNFIGTNSAGAPGLGNQLAGIQLYLADGALIGGTEAGEGNEIAYNGFNGIFLRWGGRNQFIGNRIHDNALLGIEVSPQGPMANDGLDADGGPNNGQNFPVIRSANVQGGNVTISGELRSEPLRSYLIEFNHSAQCDPSGLGQGEQPIGFAFAMTNAAGAADFNVTLPLASMQGVVTAIATSPENASSEFSPCHGLVGPNPGQFQLWRESFIAYEGLPYVDVAIVRSLGNQGAASVQLDTSNDSAIAPADYGTVSQRIAFADGETLKMVRIPIVTDNLTEGQEQFQITLSAPLGGATLGTRMQSPGIIIDVGSDFPLFGIDDQSIDAPQSGTGAMTFTVTLSPSDIPQTINFATVDATAVAGQDYVATNGALEFPASNQTQTQTVTVQILPNVAGEQDESFYVDVTASGNIAVYAGYGTGVIRVAAVGGSIFGDGFED